MGNGLHLVARASVIMFFFSTPLLASGHLTGVESPSSHPVFENHPYNDEGYRPVPGFQLETFAYPEMNDIWRKQGLAPEKGCTQLAQKRGDRSDMARFLFSRKACPPGNALLRHDDVEFELDSVMMDGELIAKQNKLAGLLLKSLGADKLKFGFLFDPRRPNEPIGFWTQDQDKDHPAADIYAMCTNTFPGWVGALVPRLKFGDLCRIESVEKTASGIVFTTPDPNPTPVPPPRSESSSGSYTDYNSGYGDDSSEGTVNENNSGYEEPTRSNTLGGRIRNGVRRQVDDTLQAGYNLTHGRDGLLSGMADWKKIDQSAKFLQGDPSGALAAGRDSALLRGNYREALRYQQYKAASDLLQRAFSRR